MVKAESEVTWYLFIDNDNRSRRSAVDICLARRGVPCREVPSAARRGIFVQQTNAASTMASDAPQQSPPPDENIGPTIVGVTTSLTVLVVVTTCLRLYTRWALRKLGWDDYTIAITIVLAVTRTAIQVVQAQHSNGRHQVYVSAEDYVFNNMLGFYTQIFLFASSCLLKSSVCLLLLRIKDTRTLRISLYTVMTGLFVTNFGCIIILLAECSPVETYWKGTGGVCWDPKVRIKAFYITIGESAKRIPSSCFFTRKLMGS